MNKTRVAVIGAGGQLGSDIVEIFNKSDYLEAIPLTHSDIEITNKESVTTALDAIEFDVLINAAAYVRVDDAEGDLQKVLDINGFAAKNLAEYTSKNNKTIVYISTDYVFGSDSSRKHPYSENDAPGPVNAYGISKLAGEYFTSYPSKKFYIIRSSGLFGQAGSSGKKGNFVELMLRLAKEQKELKVVNDQIVSPTYTKDLAKQIATLLKTESYGLYHASAEGECSWYDFTKAIFRLTNTTTPVKSITSDEYKTAARRPGYSVLDNEKLKKLRINTMKTWEEGLTDYLKEKGYL